MSNEVEYDDNGFDCEGIHRDTGTKYDPDGYDYEGYNADGYDSEGFDASGYDSEGFDASGYDSEGYDSDGYNEDGFDRDGIHMDTGTCYNEDGYDCDGNMRESDFDEELEPYGTDVITRCGWAFPRDWTKLWLAGHEIEMYSNDVCIDDVNEVRHQLDRAYRATTGRHHRCCVAKHDGSLGEGGFEIATVPLTPEQTYGMFKSFDVVGQGLNVSAWDHGEEVGHHIHVNASVISPYTLGKLGVFMNHPTNREFVAHVAQRQAYYNAFEEGKKLTRPHNRVRHSVINVTGTTVEFRCFKANLRCSGILKNWEFAISAIKFCKWSSHSHLTWENYLRYLSMHRKDYPYMTAFMARGTSRFTVRFSTVMDQHSWKKVRGKTTDSLVDLGV